MHRGSASRHHGHVPSLLAERRLYLCGGGRRRLLVLGPGRQLALAAGLFLASALVAFALVGQLLLHERLAERDRELAAVKADHERFVHDSERTESRLRETMAALEQALFHQRTATRRLQDLHEALRAELDLAERAVAEAAEERDVALDLARSLGQGVEDAELWLRSTAREKAGLTARLAAAEARIEALVEEREAVRRAEKGLRWRLEVLETQLGRLRQARDSQYAWFRSWVGSQAGAIEELLTRNGIEVETLLARAITENGYGQGGPFEAAGDGERDGFVLASLDADIEDDLARMVAMQRLLVALPLAVPLDQYYVTSDFGERPDPITRRQAFHGGIDFGAPAGSAILAAAPGRVIHAGRAGPYGIMVDIDHGMGITTRYAHLRETSVEEGEWVGFRQEIGVIGSTGRATGRHLHYEIRIDDEPLDPAQFLEAGRHLIHVFKG